MDEQKEIMAKGIMFPTNEKWGEFVEKMLGRYKICDHTNKITRAILQEIQGINVSKTLKVLKSLGCSCDCEIFRNLVGLNLPSSRIMFCNHESWGEFAYAMLGIMKSNNCNHTYKATRAVLQKIRGIDVNETLDFFERMGGSCDCEVILNVIFQTREDICA
jgi:hypothetical protein